MGTRQRFHLPGSLRRGKSTAQSHGRQSEGKDYKAQHILGITENSLHTARNESISSSATARLPALSFSDATTELGSSASPPGKTDMVPELRLKASSVLLHEEYQMNTDAASSIRSRRLKPRGSASTLNSHYESQKAPLSISQQTSDSSRRDFALRKGSPVVVKSMTPEKDSQRQLRLFRSSKKRDKSGSKNLTRLGSPSPDSSTLSLISGQQSAPTSERGAKQSSRVTMQPPASKHVKNEKGGWFNPPSPSIVLGPKKNKVSPVVPVSQPLETHVKVNVRRPRTGAQHWFDDLEGDSSQDESIHEPELQQSFVAGMELAFEDGSIGTMPNGSNPAPMVPAENSRADPASAPSKASKRSSRHMLPPSAIPPRIATLNAKSSKSSLSKQGPHPSVAPSKNKATSLASTDLRYTSILDLSSSEDDEPALVQVTEHALPRIRDSIAVEALMEAEIEIGTAKAVDTKQNSSIQATPSLRRVRGGQSKRGIKTSTTAERKRPALRNTYFSDQSSEPAMENNDILTSFPSTPVEPSSRHASFRGSYLSDNASIESRRLVSITKQEESLLAAMRLRKVAPRHPTADRRLAELDRKSGAQRPPIRSDSLGAPALPKAVKPEPTHYPYSGQSSDQASCTTFQTGRSNGPSSRFSFASFQTDTSGDAQTDVSLLASPFLSPEYGVNRFSRATFFSTSSNDSREVPTGRRESNYKATLDKLSSVPTREDISSQDFIDWPYRGWEARTTLTAAH